MKIKRLVIAAIVVIAAFMMAQAEGVMIIERSGWLESAYVKWLPVNGASGYRVYVKRGGEDYKQLDDMLIRSYGSYWRADAVGLASGDYFMRVEAVDSGGEVIAYDDTGKIKVSGYDRSGAVFSSISTYKTGSGAYDDNGTLLSTAQVIYVTPFNARTVKADIISDSKGNITTYTGLQNINDAQNYAVDVPFKEAMEHYNSSLVSAGGLQGKGK